jgi:hypothetical protein
MRLLAFAAHAEPDGKQILPMSTGRRSNRLLRLVLFSLVIVMAAAGSWTVRPASPTNGSNDASRSHA